MPYTPPENEFTHLITAYDKTHELPWFYFVPLKKIFPYSMYANGAKEKMARLHLTDRAASTFLDYSQSWDGQKGGPVFDLRTLRHYSKSDYKKWQNIGTKALESIAGFMGVIGGMLADDYAEKGKAEAQEKIGDSFWENYPELKEEALLAKQAYYAQLQPQTPKDDFVREGQNISTPGEDELVIAFNDKNLKKLKELWDELAANGWELLARKKKSPSSPPAGTQPE